MMEFRDHCLRLLAFDRWANHESLLSLRRGGIPEAKAVALMAHILSAEKLWLERLQKQPQSMPVWPGSTLAECAGLVETVADALQKYLETLEPGDFSRVIEYRNSKGEPWSSRVEDVLMHVFFHSAYHRGQIALQLRSSGFEPVLTDFIHAVRQGFVK